MRPYLTLLLIVASAAAQAQVNRCDTPAGVVYQQAPCAGGKVIVQAPATPPPEAPGKELCAAAAPGAFKDPASVKVEGVHLVGHHAVDYLGTKVSATTYGMLINARNEFGGYTGVKPYFCFVDSAEKNVYKISSRIE